MVIYAFFIGLVLGALVSTILIQLWAEKSVKKYLRELKAEQDK